VEELSTRERGFVVAAVRALGPGAEAACSSPPGRRLAAELAHDPTRLAEEATRLGRAVPLGIAEVHPSWYSAPRVSKRPDAAAYLARAAFGHLVEMGERERPGELDLERRSPAQLHELLVALGRRRVATALSVAPRGALARLCARLGEPAASELAGEVRALAGLVATREIAAAQRALHKAELSDGDAGRLFTTLGCAWLGAALAQLGGDRLRRVAQRLPLPIGQALVGGAEGADGEGALAAAAALLASPRLRAV
jgi:hypothetical protein